MSDVLLAILIVLMALFVLALFYCVARVAAGDEYAAQEKAKRGGK